MVCGLGTRVEYQILASSRPSLFQSLSRNFESYLSTFYLDSAAMAIAGHITYIEIAGLS